MTVWATLIPVGSALAGSALTIVGSMSSQALTDRRASRREIVRRHDEFAVRRFEIERETLLALQEVIGELAIAVAQLQTQDPTELSPLHLKVVQCVATIQRLAHRVLADDAREAALDVVGGVIAAGSDLAEIHESLSRTYGKAQSTLGEALRRDPFA